MIIQDKELGIINIDDNKFQEYCKLMEPFIKRDTYCKLIPYIVYDRN